MARPNATSANRHQREALVPQQDQRAGATATRPAMQLLAVIAHRVLDDLPRQRGDDRRDQHRLRDHHRRRREQDAHRAQRPGARQQQVDHQPDHHRRQRKQRVDQHQHHAAPAEPSDRNGRAKQQTGDGRDHAGGSADAEGQTDDVPQLGVAAGHQLEDVEQAVEKRGHENRRLNAKRGRDAYPRSQRPVRPYEVECIGFRSTTPWSATARRLRPPLRRTRIPALRTCTIR